MLEFVGYWLSFYDYDIDRPKEKGVLSMIKVDMHVHSRNSGDNDADLEEIIERAVERGIDGIAVTEHYSYEASEPVERLRGKYKSIIMLFRGVEFSTQDGHCLVFGADTDKLGLRAAPAADFVRLVTEAGGVAIPSHPFRGGNSMGELVKSLHGIVGIEGYNGANMYAMNAKAIQTAELLKLPFTGGSDAHSPREVGSCYTEFSDGLTLENFIDYLKVGMFRGVDARRISRGPDI